MYILCTMYIYNVRGGVARNQYIVYVTIIALTRPDGEDILKSTLPVLPMCFRLSIMSYYIHNKTRQKYIRKFCLAEFSTLNATLHGAAKRGEHFK